MKISIDEERLRKQLIEKSFETDHGSVVKLASILEAIRSLICKHAGCRNEARYDSGYCGIHDIQFNDGQGKRTTCPE